MTRSELIQQLGFTTGGTTTQLFDELEESGFITCYQPFGKTARDGIYKLADEYSLFYLKFIQGRRAIGKDTWHKIAEGHSYVSWCETYTGFAGIYTEESSWRYNAGREEKGGQIDLLLDRNDHCINICEREFSKSEFVIDKGYALELDNKIQVFKDQTKTSKSIFPTMITTFGTKRNIHYIGHIASEVMIEDLFQ